MEFRLETFFRSRRHQIMMDSPSIDVEILQRDLVLSAKRIFEPMMDFLGVSTEAKVFDKINLGILEHHVCEVAMEYQGAHYNDRLEVIKLI
jgi:hypothetical protein